MVVKNVPVLACVRICDKLAYRYTFMVFFIYAARLRISDYYSRREAVHVELEMKFILECFFKIIKLVVV